MKKALIIWVVGLLTYVPYGIYYLLFKAEMQEYAFWIVSVLFWIFGYWGLVGPLITAIKFRRILKALENIKAREDFETLINNPDNEDTVIKFVAEENKVPEFIARWAYQKMKTQLQTAWQEKKARDATSAKV